jgi:hypothetical protein
MPIKATSTLDVPTNLISLGFSIDPFIGSIMPMSARLMGSLLIRTLMEQPMLSSM